MKAKKIVQKWTTREWPEGYPPSRLELTLTAKKEGTELKMLHSRVPKEQVPKYTEGWRSAYWDPLKAYLARAAPKAPGKVRPRARRSRASAPR